MFSLTGKKVLLDEAAQRRIVDAIREAEQHTTGEIRVYAEPRCRYVDPMVRAAELFVRLKMDQTAARNAVIIYIAVDDREFALYGDAGLHEKAGGADFWKAAARQLAGHLQDKGLVEAICKCVYELGAALAQHFPHDPAVKKNELPDEIVFGK